MKNTLSLVAIGVLSIGTIGVNRTSNERKKLFPFIARMLTKGFFRSDRTIWPNSVVPGGVYNSSEFVTRPDRVAREHYRGIDPKSIQPWESFGGTFMGAYRVKDVIYWRKIRIPRGEILLRAMRGSEIVFIRRRCGNTLVSVPPGPARIPPRDLVPPNGESTPPGNDTTGEPPLPLPGLPFEMGFFPLIPTWTPPIPTPALPQAPLYPPSDGHLFWPPAPPFGGGYGFGGGSPVIVTGVAPTGEPIPEPNQFWCVAGVLAVLEVIRFCHGRRVVLSV